MGKERDEAESRPESGQLRQSDPAGEVGPSQGGSQGFPDTSEPEIPIDLGPTLIMGIPQSGASAEWEALPEYRPEIEGYSDLQELHRGGQGIVYRALQESTRRSVAIKVLREGPQADGSARKRFQREVEIVAQLNHPNIVSIFDSGTTSAGHPYFVMEYVHGLEFDQYVRKKDLTVEETLRMLRVVLDAVHHAHEKGVIHRDLKPSNILVDDLGQPKLVDFGLARALVASPDSFASVAGQVLGTMAYMSPEQVRADPEDIDHRTDVYSLGVILYEIATGTAPYPETTRIVEILHHITDTTPRLPVRAWNSETGLHRRSGRHRAPSGKCPIDSELETIVLKAISKEPVRRYGTAHAFAEDLDRYLEGRPIEARRDSGIYVIRKKLQRNRRGVLFGLAATLAVAAALVLAMRLSRAPAPELPPEVIAQYEAAEQVYIRQRETLRSAIDERVVAGELTLDPLTQESLKIVEDAIVELRAALEREPHNPSLRDLLLRTYEREVDMLKRISSSPMGPWDRTKGP